MCNRIFIKMNSKCKKIKRKKVFTYIAKNLKKKTVTLSIKKY